MKFWFWAISCNLLTKTEALTNLSAVYFRERVFRGLVSAFHGFSGNNIEVVLKNRKHFWNPRNFWGWENMFPDQLTREQPKGCGGIGILGAVRNVSDNKWQHAHTYFISHLFDYFWPRGTTQKVYCILWHENIFVNVGRNWSCLQLTMGGSLCLFCDVVLDKVLWGSGAFPAGSRLSEPTWELFHIGMRQGCCCLSYTKYVSAKLYSCE